MFDFFNRQFVGQLFFLTLCANRLNKKIKDALTGKSVLTKILMTNLEMIFDPFFLTKEKGKFGDVFTISIESEPTHTHTTNTHHQHTPQTHTPPIHTQPTHTPPTHKHTQHTKFQMPFEMVNNLKTKLFTNPNNNKVVCCFFL